MNHPLVGMWQLVRIEREGESAGGSGPSPKGALVYGEQGWMSESLLLPAEGGGTRTVIYCGTYEIRGDQVIHQPLFHLDNSQVGLDLPRGFEVAEDGQSFVLIVGGGRLHWERVK
ncbi:hypothetical protein BH23CHL2_BH23CHL2_12440 [soil metagenome]